MNLIVFQRNIGINAGAADKTFCLLQGCAIVVMKVHGIEDDI